MVECTKCEIPMTNEEQKEVMLNILVKFSDFCEKNNLRYFLDAGTLLGAVRHNGFIPWDDDIDVNMPREDYERFLKLLETRNYLLSNKIKVELPQDHLHAYAKICDERTYLIEYPEKYPMRVAVYVDLFVKDGIKDDSWKSKMLCKKSEILGLIQWFNKFSIYAWKNDNSIIKRIVACLGRIIIKDPNYPVRMQDKLIQQNAINNPISQCKYVTTLTNGEFHKIAPKECFESHIMMDFENKKFRCPTGYDTYLKCLYPGDYMQLPPEEKRVHHNIEVYWKTEEEREEFYREVRV